jgi:hypothetical protein
MKTNKFLNVSIGIAAIAGLMFTSCKKDNMTDEETNSAEDNASAETIYNDINAMAGQASDIHGGSMSNYRLSDADLICSLSCATLVWDSLNHTVTITFNGQTCQDGRTRSGSLIVDYSASTNGATHYRDPGFSCTVASNNYVVDGNAVNIISKTISNTTPVGFNPASTNETWHIDAHIQITKASGGSIDWTCSRNKELLNTSDHAVYVDASTPITWSLARVGHTGSASGTCADGESFSATITSMLIRDFGGCIVSGKHPIIQGTLDFTKGSRPVRHIDFGNGSCDNLATVTVNNHVRTITLH